MWAKRHFPKLVQPPASSHNRPPQRATPPAPPNLLWSPVVHPSPWLPASASSAPRFGCPGPSVLLPGGPGSGARDAFGAGPGQFDSGWGWRSTAHSPWPATGQQKCIERDLRKWAKNEKKSTSTSKKENQRMQQHRASSSPACTPWTSAQDSGRTCKTRGGRLRLLQDGFRLRSPTTK